MYSTPYLSILQFKTAVENSNNKKANKYINYNTLRNSLKSQFKSVVYSSLTKNLENNLFMSFGGIIVDPLVDGIVESTVTPAGLSLLIYTGSLSTPDGKLESYTPPDNNNKIKKNINNDTKSDISLYYQSFNVFIYLFL